MLGRMTRAGVIALCAFASPIAQASAQDFYKGRILTILVGFPPGGGYDTNARLLSRHIGEHIPGHPAVIVQNMPGAASITAVNYLDLTAPKDGTFIDTFTFGQIGDSRVRPDRVKADFRKFSWIGSTGEDPPFCYVWHTLGIDTIDQLRKHGKIHMGMTAPGALDDIGERILKSLFDVDVQQVAGYPGSAEAGVAMERGEVDGGCGDWGNIPPDWIAEHKIVPILNFASRRPEGMAESVPFAVDIAKSDRDRSIIRLLTGSAAIGRPFIASLAVPPDRIEILREAFEATMKDPNFLADAERSRLPITPKIGTDAQKIVDEIYRTPDDFVQAARKIMDE
jgi:tripartite-type tricarboxylate transporter receptor subunit TctC